jgi:DNA/RNA-binding domain of Phe-tRNA-synthetase-like protein
MIKITISPELKLKCPELRLACIDAKVEVFESDDQLKQETDRQIKRISASTVTEDISKNEVIQASRMAYKSCGKDPARYRLSAEALLRRVVSGKGLYQINNVVDQLNLVSISTGFSIGGYDADLIQGEVIFGIGRAKEPYSGIGRGELNIEHIPVFRDETGAFGTPTSDSERTGVTNTTKHFLMIFIDFGSNTQLSNAVGLATSLLTAHCKAEILEIKFIE